MISFLPQQNRPIVLGRGIHGAEAMRNLPITVHGFRAGVTTSNPNSSAGVVVACCIAETLQSLPDLRIPLRLSLFPGKPLLLEFPPFKNRVSFFHSAIPAQLKINDGPAHFPAGEHAPMGGFRW
jgi:hypothetical protein